MNTMKHHLLMFSKKMRIGERVCKSICQNKNFNLNWLNWLIISSTITIPRWLKIMKNKVKCCQLVTGISVAQLHFVTYWLWMLVHHSVTYMACKKVKCFHEKTGKFQFQVGCIYFPPIKQNKSFMDQVGNFCFDIWHWKVISNEKGD